MDIISLITALGTLVSAVATGFSSTLGYKTLREMQKQRKANHNPELLVLETDFYFKKSSSFHTIYSNSSLMSKKEKGHPVSSPCNIDLKSNMFYMDVVNIGNSAAKDISIRWEFDVKEFIKNIKNTIIHIDETSDTILLLDGKGCHCISAKQYEDIKKEFILSYDSNASNKIQIPLPYTFLYLMGIYFYDTLYINPYKITDRMKNHETDQSHSNKVNSPKFFPHLKFNISYKNVLNQKFSTTGNLRFKFKNGTINSTEPEIFYMMGHIDNY